MDPLTDSGLRSEPIEGWDRAIDQERMLAALERAIDTLPAEQREVVVLRDRLGLSYDEVAETLGLKVAAVKSRLFRARVTVPRLGLDEPPPFVYEWEFTTAAAK